MKFKFINFLLNIHYNICIQTVLKCITRSLVTMTLFRIGFKILLFYVEVGISVLPIMNNHEIIYLIIYQVCEIQNK